MNPINEQLAAIRARCEAATPGPWTSTGAAEWTPKQKSVFDEIGAGIESPCGEVVQGGLQDEQGGAVGVLLNADADFIANARADVPRTLDALEVATKALEIIRDGAAENIDKDDYSRGFHEWAKATLASMADALAGEA
jgi:hypothetical protein